MNIKFLELFGIIFILIGLIFSFNIFKHYTVFFLVGWTLLMIYLNRTRFQYSPIMKEVKNLKFIFYFLLLGVFLTLIIEYFGSFRYPSWIYNFDFYNFTFDFWFSIGAYLMYIPATYETYFLVSKTLHFKKKESKIKTPFTPILILSLFLIIIPNFGAFQRFNKMSYPFTMLGLTFLLDFITFKKTKDSVMNNIVDIKYLLVLGITLFLISIPSEYTNIFQFVWRYVNLPFLEFTLFRVPLIVLAGWSTLIVAWINIFNLAKYFSK